MPRHHPPLRPDLRSASALVRYLSMTLCPPTPGMTLHHTLHAILSFVWVVIVL